MSRPRLSLVVALAALSGCPLWATLDEKGLHPSQSDELPPKPRTCVAGVVWRAGGLATPMGGATVTLTREGAAPVETMSTSSGAYRVCPDWRFPPAGGGLNGVITLSVGERAFRQDVVLTEGHELAVDLTFGSPSLDAAAH